MHILVGWLVDGTGAPAKTRVLLTVCNGTVRAVKSGVTGDLPTQNLVDLGHCTIIPPLVDCHVHLCLSGERDPSLRQAQVQMPFDRAQTSIRAHLVDDLAHGIIAVRDAGDHAGQTLRFKHSLLAAEPLPMVVRCAGRAWHAAGRYGRFLGRAPATGESLADALRRTSEDIDQLKIIHSGINSLREFGRPTAPQFAFGDLRMAISLARSQGLATMVHANGEKPVGEALAAGCRSIEHGYFMGLANLQTMAEEGISWVPTVTPMAVLADEADHSPLQRDIAARTVDHQLEQLRQATLLGVTVALGTDSGSYGVLHGRSVAEELRFLGEAGFSLESAVQSATANGAQLLGLAKEMGLVARGFPASFVAVQGSPAQLLDRIATPHSVWVRGTMLNQVRQEKS
jgi:imidazolonepropionase-like amidohydrolase